MAYNLFYEYLSSFECHLSAEIKGDPKLGISSDLYVMDHLEPLI